MASITTRETASGVGDRAGITNNAGPLSNAQIDQNFIELNNDKLEVSDASFLNTPDTVVKRDSQGGFLMGTLGAGTINASSLSLTNKLPVSEGGTGASNASQARTNLGLTIGTNVQAYDADLTSLAGLSTTGIVYRSGAASFTAGNNLSSVQLQLKSLGVGTAGSSTTGEIRATNQITAYYSDERLKKNINPIENAVDKVMSLRGVTYQPNEIAESFGFNTNNNEVGVIAQDVQKVLPEAVKPAPFDIMLYEGTEISKSGQDYQTVQYEKLVPLLIEAIKELQAEIAELKESR